VTLVYFVGTLKGAMGSDNCVLHRSSQEEKWEVTLVLVSYVWELQIKFLTFRSLLVYCWMRQ